MPVARFQLPDGRVGRFEVPEGTTPEQAQQQIEAFVAQQQTQQPAPSDLPGSGQPQPAPAMSVQPSLSDRLIGAGEAGLTLLTGATGGTLGMIGGTIGGIAGQIASGELGTEEGGNRAHQSAMEAAQALTYAPRTRSGQQQTAAVGEVLEPLAALAPIMPEVAMLGEAAQAARPAVSTAVQAARQTPAAQAVSKALTRAPSALVDASGQPTAAFSKALKTADIQFENIASDLADIPATAKPQEAVDAVIRKKLDRGDTDDFLATKRVEPILDKVVDDEVAAAALKQGFRPGDVQMVKVATPGTARRMQQMLNIRRATYANERLGLDKRPTDVLGDSVLDRFNYIRATANKARSELNTIADKELAGKPINVGGVVDNFYKELDGLDVIVDRSGGVPKLDFTGSIISKDKSSQRVIRNVAELLAEDRAPDALRAHKLKRQLDAMIDFQKKSNGGLTESGRNFAKSMRASLNQSIREVSPDYARVNDVLSTSLESMNEFERILGPSIDLWAPGANKAIGQDLRGLMSNRKSRVRLENSVNSIDETARALGGQFDDNLGDLALFAKTLDDQFGASARTSLGGELESSANRVLRGTQGLKEEVIDRAAKKMGDLRNVNDREAFKAMDALLRRQAAQRKLGADPPATITP